MDDGYSLRSIAVFIGLVILDALFYGFSSGVQNVNEAMLEQQAQQGDPKARRLLKVLQRPEYLIPEIQIISNLVSLITGIYIFDHVQIFVNNLLLQIGVVRNDWISSVSILLVGMILLVVLISFGIIIPKQHAAKYPKHWCYAALTVISLFNVLFTPLIWLITNISKVVLKGLGIGPGFMSEKVTEQDVKTIVNESHEQGFLEAREAEMITNIVDLDTKEAADIMTNRKNIIAIDAESTLAEAVEFILNEGSKSRYPVFKDGLDDIIGILHMKDAVIYAKREEFQQQTLEQIPGILRQAYFIPETRNVHSLFKEMQFEKIQMEVIVDEYGQTAGIITMEDILEEIVGSISDEYDQEENYIVECGENLYLIKGMTPLEEIEKILKIEFVNDEYDTLNGFLISRLDRIPEEDEHSQIEYENYLFEITKVQNKMIDLVKVSPIL